MMSSLRAEFRKLLSVRSTYIVTILVTVLVAFIAFYGEGWHLSPAELRMPNQLSGDVFGALNLAIFGAIIGILLMTHEYRYNTITYTLTDSNSRSRVLRSKIIVVSTYAIFLTVLIGVLSPVAAYLGVHAHGHVLAHQTLQVSNLAWRSLFFGWSSGMLGLVLATLIRSQVGAISALFIIPIGIEPLLTLLLNTKAVYLPFTAQAEVIGNGMRGAGTPLSAGKAAIVFSIYLVIGWIVAWILFLRRDAN